MRQAGIISLFVSSALAHFNLRSIVVDGTTYPPFDSRIDGYLGPKLKRIEWAHEGVKGMPTATPYNPITNISSPSLACQPEPRAPLLKAPVRAGAKVQFNWTPIVRMHSGPALVYMAEYTPGLKPYEAKFFKIWELGYDSAKGKWANVIASDNNNSFTVQIPNDIKSGTYIIRAEIIALHGNGNRNASSPPSPLAGGQYYIGCVNADVLGGGNARPEGVTFPGAYTKEMNLASIYLPLANHTKEQEAQGHTFNSKYVLPGPPVYQGKYDAPTGSPPTVTETGAMTGELKAKYDKVIRQLDEAGMKSILYINGNGNQNVKLDPAKGQGFFAELAAMGKEKDRIIAGPDMADLKAAVEKAF